MKTSLLWQTPLRATLLRRLAELLVLAALVTGAWYGQGLVRDQRLGYLAAEIERERRPQTEALLGEIENSMAEQSPDLERIQATIPTRANLGEYITFLEGRATKHRVEMQITNVTQEPEPEPEEVSPVPLVAGYVVVRLNVIVTGTTSALFEFLHDVEHGQQLSAVPEWMLRSAQRTGRGVAVPSGIGTPPGDAATESVPDNNQLAAEIILITEDDGSQDAS